MKELKKLGHTIWLVIAYVGYPVLIIDDEWPQESNGFRLITVKWTFLT